MRLPALFRSEGRSPASSGLAWVVGLLGLLILTAPLRAAEQPLLRVGALLAIVGLLELIHGVRRVETAAVRRTVASAAMTILMALLVINAPFLVGTALVIFLAIVFALEGGRYAVAAWRAPDRRSLLLAALAATGDGSVALLLFLTREQSVTAVIAIAAALRAFGVAWNIATSPIYSLDDIRRTVVDDLGLGSYPEATALQAEVAAEERIRARGDRGWTISFIVTLFAIHIARMQVDGTLLGFVAPGVAVLGDMVLAVMIALVAIVPAIISLRGSTRWLETRVWRWYLTSDTAADHWRHRLADKWLRYRLRRGMHLREMRFSIPAAIWKSLGSGLPVAAIVAATVPIWGMSWFFDTENWASGIWNSWAESRTDEWREAMVQVVAPGSAVTSPIFAVTPPGTEGDFAFIVIGDTGEGDASQHVLRDQLLSVAGRDDVRFVVVSSDVVYPNGSMVDYEAKFWLPFKGVTKPVYAIPGNHDWYDALEAFLATFLQADAARLTMRARADADLRLTSTTEARIAELISEAARLRGEYGVPTGFQRGPFFEIQTERFALVAIDTGIVRRIDREQWTWLESALTRAHGKLTMAVVGHPFYAGGHDMTAGDDDFARLKQLLLDRGVTILMAGDTHDLEYYSDPPPPHEPAVHYLVNGGGGAYLSFGTALEWPARPPTVSWAYYPDRAAVSNKIEARTPRWKRPAWWWTTRMGAWPFSAEWLSAAFDYNVAPFFQSFVEVRVEPSAGRVRLIPYGVHGRLRWRDMAHSTTLNAAGDDEGFVEWSVPIPPTSR